MYDHLMEPEYNLSWILPYVRESLRGRGNFNFDGFIDGLFQVLERVRVPTIERPSMHAGYTGRTYAFDAANIDIRSAATEAFYYLEQNRFILRPPPTNSTAFLPHGQFTVTVRGREWADGLEPLPEDYNGYMKQFDGNVDSVIRQYVSESLQTFIRGTYFASAVMIGAASEKAVYLLAEALIPALKDAAKKTLMRGFRNRPTSTST